MVLSGSKHATKIKHHLKPLTFDIVTSSLLLPYADESVYNSTPALSSESQEKEKYL